MSRAMHRYQVGVDGPVLIGLTGNPVAYGALGYSAGIEFWAEHDDSLPEVVRMFVIVGTGHPIPDDTPEGLVWHLYELTGATS